MEAAHPTGMGSCANDGNQESYCDPKRPIDFHSLIDRTDNCSCSQCDTEAEGQKTLYPTLDCLKSPFKNVIARDDELIR